MKPVKPLIVAGLAAAAFFLVFAMAPGAVAGTKKTTPPRKSTASQTPTVKKKSTPAKPSRKKKININNAHQDTLARLKGIGPEKARAIIDYRRKNGPFKKLEDIMQVKGIGKETFRDIKPYIKLK